MTMEIRFWGVRGSIASPGASTAATGGNTSCVEVRCGTTTLVLDAGTGIRALGEKLAREGAEEITLLLSHLHWDHIQGLPFFVPLYLPHVQLAVVGAPPDGATLREALAKQMTSPNFPVRLSDVACRLGTREVKGGDVIHVSTVDVRCFRGNHPGGVMAYRLTYGGRSVVYATDVEHYSVLDAGLARFVAGCDVLIYDSQYTPEEYGTKLGWGHSTFEAGAALARAAGAGQYVLFHHDPTRDDGGVAEVERRARLLFPESVAAREGMTLTLPAKALAA